MVLCALSQSQVPYLTQDHSLRFSTPVKQKTVRISINYQHQFLQLNSTSPQDTISMARRESWMLLRTTKVKALLSMYTDGVNISADHPIVIPDPEDERAPKKPQRDYATQNLHQPFTASPTPLLCTQPDGKHYIKRNGVTTTTPPPAGGSCSAGQPAKNAIA